MAVEIAAISGESRLIGDYQDGYSCHREYCISGGEPEGTMLPIEGQEYIGHANWPLPVAGQPYLVSHWELTELLPGLLFRLQVTGKTRVRTAAGGGAHATLKRNRIQKLETTGQLTITGEMIGARQATRYDAGYLYEKQRSFESIAKLTLDAAAPGGKRACQQGDWIYKSAKQGTWQNHPTDVTDITALTAGTIGAPETDPSKIDIVSGNNNDDNPFTLKAIGHVLPMHIFTLTHWRPNRSSQWPTNRFEGLASTDSFDSKYRPRRLGAGIGSEGGKWRCAEETVDDDMDSDGQELIMIRRVFWHCPGGYSWSLSKFGAWTWN